MFEKITEAEINERSMARVSTTPGRQTAFGEGNMDAEALKLRFDRLGRFIAGRLNEVLEGMADGSLADAIIVPFPGIPGESISIKRYIDNLRNGHGSLIVMKFAGRSITLDDIATFVIRTENELNSGEFAQRIDVAPGVSIRDFYDKFLLKDYESSPVKSVNGQTGEVDLTAEDVGAEPSGTVVSSITTHNDDENAHISIKRAISSLAAHVAALLDSDDMTLDQLSEIVAYIKNNKSLIDSITTAKQNKTDSSLKTESKNIVDAINEINARARDEIAVTTGTGEAYTAEVKSVTSLTRGASFIMIPHTQSTSTSATLNVNGLGAKQIKRPVSTNTSATQTGYVSNWIHKDKPIRLMYDGTYWKATDFPKVMAADLSGRVPVAGGGVPSGTANDEGKFLRCDSKGKAYWAEVADGDEVSY